MNKFFIVLIVIFFSFNSFSGVVVLGTRFVINDKTNRLKINLINDNVASYLIKSKVECNDNSNKFIIVPPLFLLPQDKSNSITIIKENIQKKDVDHICKLIITSIPRSVMNQSNDIAVAVRSNINLIYRHDKLENVDLTKLRLVKNKTGGFSLLNDTSYALTLKIDYLENNQLIFKKTINPYSSIPIQLCNKSTCSLRISVINDDESVFQKIHLSSL